MLSNIEDRYRSHAMKLLRICHQNQLMSATQGLYTLGLALVDDYDLEPGNLPSAQSIAATGKLTAYLDRQKEIDDKYLKRLTLEGRLRSHCFGLVEIKRASLNCNSSCFCGYRPGSTDIHDGMVDSTVEFMHRTVFDFLSARGTATPEYATEDMQTFDPSTVLSCISLHLAGLTLHSHRGASHIRDCLIHVAQINIDRCSEAESILIKMQELLFRLNIPGIDRPGNIFIYGKVDQRAMSDIMASQLHLALLLAVEMGNVKLLEMYECMGRGKLSDLSLHIPLLYRAFKHPLIGGLKSESARKGSNLSGGDIVMVRYLIACGCNPNAPFFPPEGTETTPWEQLLKVNPPIYLFQQHVLIKAMIEEFLEGHADLDFGLKLCTEAQRAAEVEIDMSFTQGRLVERRKTWHKSVDFYILILARRKAESSLEAIARSTQNMPGTRRRSRAKKQDKSRRYGRAGSGHDL